MSEYNNESSNRPAQSGILPWIPLILAGLYAISPIDVVPDVVPIVGWCEDALFLIVGGLNGIEKGILDANSSLRSIVKFLKWGLLILGIIGVLLVVLIVFVILKLFAK